MASRRSSSVRIGAATQQDGEDGFHDAAPFAAVEPQKREIESRPQAPLLIGVDSGVREPSE